LFVISKYFEYLCLIIDSPMKRFALQFLLLACAAASLAACDLVSQGDEERTAVSFILETTPFTKGGEFTGNSLSSNAKVYIAVTQRDPNGNILIPSLYLDGDGHPTTTSMVYDNSSSSWKVESGDLYFPLGGHSLDFLAFATDRDGESADWDDAWTPTLNSENAASGVTFSNVDTYSHQMDFMYAASNGVVANNPVAKFSFSHAQALLIFNVSFSDNTEMAFIESNGTDYKFKIDNLLFLNEAGYAEYVSDPDGISANNVLMKTVGTFTIDNSRNTLMAQWSGQAVKTDNYKLPMPMDVTVRSSANKATTENRVFSNTRDSWKVNDIQTGYTYQLGQPLLVPEQPAQNIIVEYTYDGYAYHSVVNLPRTTWNSGGVYIYTLIFSTITDQARFIIDISTLEEVNGGEI
jgi:hypothetical protein